MDEQPTLPYVVGLRTLFFYDKERPAWDGSGFRPLLTDIWYPAAASAQEAPIYVGPANAPLFYVGTAARDADLADSLQSFPLILLSHGTGGTALELGWLACALASQGYIVAGVNHHGNTALESYTAQGFARVWERPRDLTVMLDQLLEHKLFKSRINLQQIGVAGFSLGGYTALALAGGLLNFQALLDELAQAGQSLASLVPPEFPDPAALLTEIESLIDSEAVYRQSYREPRVRAAFAIAPALGQAFTADDLAPIEIPVQLVAGMADVNTPPVFNAMRYAQSIKRCKLKLLEGEVGHYTFLAEPMPAGYEVLPALCLDAPGVDRKVIHQQVGAHAVEFFNQHLVDACDLPSLPDFAVRALPASACSS